MVNVAMSAQRRKDTDQSIAVQFDISLTKKSVEMECKSNPFSPTNSSQQFRILMLNAKM